jgi:(S)-mandelate dehydrogenase
MHAHNTMSHRSPLARDPIRPRVAPVPGPVHGVDDARRLARRRQPRIIFDFIDGAAGQETAASLNQSALSAIRLAPRVLGEVAGNDLGSSILGLPLGLPFGIAPMGMCNLAWPGADRMLAAEAMRRTMALCVSTASSTSLEDMLRLTDGQAWFQLYVSGSAEAGMVLVERASAAGYGTLILTVDVPKVAPRPRDVRNGFQTPFRLRPSQFLDFALHPHWSLSTLKAGVPTTANFQLDNGANRFDRHASRAGANWEFLDRLRAAWKGRLIVKGVLSPDDALRIRDAGADAIYVSNHGGRQLDAAPAAITMLPRVRAAVGASYPLLFDGGVRSGEDIVKALASGADFVLLGRPMLYALGADGARGLADLVDALQEGIAVTLAQIGLRRVRDIDHRVLGATAAITTHPFHPTETQS